MSSSRLVGALGLAAVLLAAVSSRTAGAAIVSKKLALAPVDGVQEVSVEADRVRVGQIRFADKPDAPGWFSKGGYTVKVRVDNDGSQDQEVGIALVFYDSDGNVVAAGTGGTKVGYLKRGDRDTHSIDFNYVFRNARNATTFAVTLETRARSAKEAAPPAVPGSVKK